MMSFEFGSPKTTPWQQQQRIQRDHSTTSNYNTSNKRKSKYKMLQEQDLFKAAKDEGFVQVLRESDLIENSVNEKNKKPNYPGDVRMLKLNYHRLQNISIVDLCERLEICNLSNNFIQDIEPLKWCINLFCLDLHSNQINHLPGNQFWSSLKHLTILYLHDNGISRLEELKYISHSPSLMFLTLYDTPICLKKNYRHCAVNAIFSLKALDNHVVSDEEIIEDAKFSDRFKPLKENLSFQSQYLTLKQKSALSYNDTWKVINDDLASINNIQSKFCPVIVLQRCIRGFLVRLKYNYIRDTRLWAAVSIQRFYRSYKGYPNPPPSSPNQEYLYKSLSSIRLDYETYLKLRRSKHKSTMSMKSDKPLPFRLPYLQDSEDRGCLTKQKPFRHHINVNLQSLEGKTDELLDKALMNLQLDSSIITVIPRKKRCTPTYVNSNRFVTNDYATDREGLKLLLKKDFKAIARSLGLPTVPTDVNKRSATIGKYRTQYSFLGNIDNGMKTENTNCLEPGQENVGFRLSIQKPFVMLHDPLEELVLRTIEGADDIRQSVKVIAEKHREKTVSLNKIHEAKKTNNRVHELFLKSQANMGFSAFRAVDRAYRDRNQAENLMRRAVYVKQIQRQENTGRRRVKRFRRNYQHEACLKKHNEKVQILEKLEENRLKEALLHEKTAALKFKLSESQKRSKNNLQFTTDFRSHIASISRALGRQEHVQRKKAQIKKNKAKVKNMRDEMGEKKTVVKDYLEQQKLNRQTDVAAMKEDLETQLLEKAAKREVELRKRLKEQEEKAVRPLQSPVALHIHEMESATFDDHVGEDDDSCYYSHADLVLQMKNYISPSL